MEYRKCLVLHKKQWDRLKKQGGDIEKPAEVIHEEEKNKYVQALNDRSREWTKNWPDTVDGLMAIIEKRKVRQHERDLAFITAYKQKQNEKFDNRKTVAEAKQKIFNNSCYGRQLLSAVLKSKQIEEIEAQKKFKVVVKEDIIKQEYELVRKIASMQNNLYDLDKKQDRDKIRREIVTKETANINKIMHANKVAKHSKAREEEKQFELEDARSMKQLLDYEAHEKDHCKEEERRAVKQYEMEQELIREQRQKIEHLDVALSELASKYQDIRRCKENKMRKEAMTSRGESETYKKNCDNLRKSQEKEMQTYDNFVNKGIADLEKRQFLKEKEQKEKQIASITELLESTQSNKLATEEKEWNKHCNKCYCDRQSLFTKYNRRIVKEVRGGGDEPKKPESFLAPNNKLSEALREREKVPSAWTGTKGENEYFVKEAKATLKGCKYKDAARKVVRNFMKVNLVDCTHLEYAEDFVQQTPMENCNQKKGKVHFRKIVFQI